MSRTDKDMPWWLLAEEWEPQHSRCFDMPYNRFWSQDRRVRECDLPLEPSVKQYHECTGRIRRHSKHRCIWVPVWPKWLHRWPSPPTWYINYIDASPTRVKVRDDCILARKQYRATGDVDVVPPVNQHRHCAKWSYW